MTTPISTSTAYASPADMRARIDFRQLGDVVNDDGTRETSTAVFDANAKVTAALLDASGMVEMYAIRGNKYTVADLQGLVGAGRNILIKLVVELAWWNLSGRRFQKKEIPPETAWAFSVLDDLASGAKVFPLQEQADAGNPHNGFMTQQEWLTLNPAIVQSRRYWGRRAWENVPGGSSGGSSCDCDC